MNESSESAQNVLDLIPFAVLQCHVTASGFQYQETAAKEIEGKETFQHMATPVPRIFAHIYACMLSLCVEVLRLEIKYRITKPSGNCIEGKLYKKIVRL